jgi:hypothetical protein
MLMGFGVRVQGLGFTVYGYRNLRLYSLGFGFMDKCAVKVCGGVQGLPQLAVSLASLATLLAVRVCFL